MQTQNFNNHRRFVLPYHFVLLPLLVIVLVEAIINLAHAHHENVLGASLIVALSLLVILLAFFLRSFALKAQDRAIRAEQNFRHYVAAGEPLNSSLSMQQIIALRFAGDDEFVALAKKAAAENMAPKDIKRSIKNWKGDYNRA